MAVLGIMVCLMCGSAVPAASTLCLWWRVSFLVRIHKARMERQVRHSEDSRHARVLDRERDGGFASSTGAEEAHRGSCCCQAAQRGRFTLARRRRTLFSA
uniref:Putative secreted protein n=1 Tax=Ixodes ricinus TaxID=34613 RepID=A0A6B0UI97_IXORI